MYILPCYAKPKGSICLLYQIRYCLLALQSSTYFLTDVSIWFASRPICGLMLYVLALFANTKHSYNIYSMRHNVFEVAPTLYKRYTHGFFSFTGMNVTVCCRTLAVNKIEEIPKHAFENMSKLEVL